MPLLSKARLLLLLCLVAAPQHVAALARFQSWYPRYAPALTYVVANNCSQQYTAYLENSRRHTEFDEQLAIWGIDSVKGPLIGCILAAAPDYVKANFANAQVLLGLMPTILGLLGPGVEETAALLVTGPQPLLALLISACSPLVSLGRGLSFGNTFTMWKIDPAPHWLRRSFWLTGIEYLIVLGAIGNIAELSWELGLRVSFSFFQDTAWLPGVWAVGGLALHLMGVLTLITRVAVGPCSDVADTSALPRTMKWIRWRFLPSKRKGGVHITLLPSHSVYLLLVSAVMISTLCYIIFGTIIFSGILFISVHDAAGVIARYMASVAMCRLVLIVELALLHDAVTIEEFDKPYKRIQQASDSKR